MSKSIPWHWGRGKTDMTARETSRLPIYPVPGAPAPATPSSPLTADTICLARKNLTTYQTSNSPNWVFYRVLSPELPVNRHTTRTPQAHPMLETAGSGPFSTGGSERRHSQLARRGRAGHQHPYEKYGLTAGLGWKLGFQGTARPWGITHVSPASVSPLWEECCLSFP